MKNIIAKLSVAGTSSILVSEAVNLEPLWNALITLGISIISVFAVEGIAWLKSFIKKHIKKNEEDEKKEGD